MIIGEVCLMTRDVVRLADFYKWLLGVENGSDDAWHQTIFADETMLTVCHDETSGNTGSNICLAFSVKDLDAEYARLKAAGICIIEPPTVRPWGMKNMSFEDPDGNRLYFRTPIE